VIGRLVGILVERQPPLLVVDVGGIGYEVEAPMSTFYQLPPLGDRVTLRIHLVVREDAHLLYGFASERERQLFRALLKVNGVGARLALTILSGISYDEFVRSIQEGSSATLVRLPGVGKKTADRLIVELRDRVADWGVTAVEACGAQLPITVVSDVERDAISALVALGYKPVEASRLVAAVKSEGMGSEALIRAALRQAVKV
jgi:holliday junction DNA helicase RuvA